VQRREEVSELKSEVGLCSTGYLVVENFIVGIYGVVKCGANCGANLAYAKSTRMLGYFLFFFTILGYT